jgi:DcaP outer membrane protein
MTKHVWLVTALVLTGVPVVTGQEQKAPPTAQELLQLIDAQQALIDEQRLRIDALQRQLEEVRALVSSTGGGAAVDAQKAAPPESDPGRQYPELPPDLITTGDFPGSIKIPGSDAAFRLGGMVRVNWVTTLDPLLVDDRFITEDIPVDVVGAPVGGRVDVMAIPSRFNLDVRTPTGVGYMRAFLEADFAGSGNTLRLRHAYGQWRRLLFGQTWSTFSDPEAVPDGIDFEGLNAIIHFRQPQVRWTWAPAARVRVAFALENPDAEITDATAANQRPDFVGRFRWEAKGGGHIQTAALFRRLRGFPSNAPADLVGANAWGVNVTGRLPSSPSSERDAVLFQFNRGDGIGHYVTDLNAAGGQDGVFDATSNTVRVLPAFSGYVSYEHWWSARLHSAFTGAFVNVANLEIQPGTAFHVTRRYSGNLIWSPIKRLELVGEFLYGTRINQNQNRLSAAQMQFGSTFRF